MNGRNLDTFENAPVARAVITNVIPAIISMIMVLVYNLADTFFIGQTKDPYMVAAVSVATPVFLIFMAIGMLFGVGGTSLISRMLGEGRGEEARHVSAFCFWTGAAVGLFGFAFIWLFMDPICRLIGSSPDTIAYVKDYLGIVAIGIPALVVSNSFSNILRAEGKANLAMMGMIIGNLANIILDPIMILWMGWGVAGAAAATTIGNILALLFYIFYYLRGKSILSIHPKDYTIKGKIVGGVFAIGIPASLNSILMSTSNIIVNNLMHQHGDMAVAGLGVAFKVNMVAVMLLIGMGTGIQPLLGYCYGAGNKARFGKILRFSLTLAIGLSLVMTVLCYLGAGPMVSAFLEAQDAHAYGMQFARILIYSGPVIGILFVMTNAIQAMGAAIPSLILSISRQGLVFIPVLFLFNALFGTPESLVTAQPVADYIAVTLSVILFLVTYRRRFRSADAQPEPLPQEG